MKRNAIVVFLVLFLAASGFVPAPAYSAAQYQRLPYKEFIFQPGELLSSHSPSIVELPDGELFAVWYAATKWCPEAVIWSSRRPAGSDRWTKPSVIHVSRGHSTKNPVLHMNRDGKLLLFWSEEFRWFRLKTDKLRMKMSEDFGRNWGKARDCGRFSGFLPRAHALTLRDGSVVLPIYTDWSTSAAVTKSNDGGMTWESPRFILFLLGTQPTIIQRSDMSLFTMMRSGTWPRRAWQAQSFDLGRTWKDRRVSGVDNPGSSLEMLKLKSGRVVLVFNDSKEDRSNLSMALSYDEGRTWPCSRMIEKMPGRAHCYPSVIQDKEGLIHVLYSYDGRKTIAHFVTDEEWIEGRKK